MSNQDASSKPQEGTVAPVQVVALWKHPLVLFTTLIAAIPTVLAYLIQIKELPGLPANVLGWITSAIGILGLVATILRLLGLLGAPSVTPTAAAKLIQTAPDETKA